MSRRQRPSLFADASMADTPATLRNRVLALAVTTLAALCSLAPALALQTPTDPAGDPRLDRALELLDQGRTAKARKLLTRLETDRPHLAPTIRLLEAERANERGDWIRARDLAQAALELATDEQTTILAIATRAVALAGSGNIAGDTATAVAQGIDEMRRFVADRSDDAVTDRIRMRLCRVRELLPAEHPSSLSKAELPQGGDFKYLPKADPARGIETVKPQQIAQRDIDATSEQASQMKGLHQARIDGVIDADGCFAGHRVTSTTDEAFSPIALAAVRGWVYRPPRCNGEAVGMFFSATVRMAPDRSLR